MTMTEERKQGWIEAASRLLRVALQSPRARGGLRTVLGYLDPDHAPELVRTALSTDPELPHAVLGALPDAANIVIEVVAALVREACGRPAALVREAVDQLKARVRVRTLGQATGAVLARVVALGQIESEALRAGPANATSELLVSDRGMPAHCAPATGRRAPSLASQFALGLTDGLRQDGLAPGDALRRLTLAGVEALLGGLEQQLRHSPDLAGSLARLQQELAQLLAEHPDAVQQAMAPLLRPLLDALSGNAR